MQELVDNHTAVWIGLTDLGSHQNSSAPRFMWTDGHSLTSHAHWQVGEPSSAGHLHCVQADLEGWALAHSGCASTKLPFVCKKKGE